MMNPLRLLFVFLVLLASTNLNLEAQDQTIPNPPFIGQTLTFFQPGSWTLTVPSGFTVGIEVKAWGGGGGGGGGSNQAGGGGGGAYAKSSFTIGSGSYTITVGGGGTIDANGGDSSFETTVIAGGGEGARGNSGGAGGTGIGDVTIPGNMGNDRIPGKNGAGGDGGASGSVGPNGESGAGGAGGPGNLSGLGGNGENGSLFGGGGGGKGFGGAASGLGANGVVIIRVLSGALPVEFTRFEVQPKEDMVELAWATATEINNDFFQIEHSRDGVQFKSVGKVKGEGTTTEFKEYHFMHRDPVEGTNYYRLKQVDFDGAFQYSEVTVIEMDSRTGGIQIFPNPAVNRATIRMSERPEKVRFSLTNLLGQGFDLQPIRHDGGWELDLNSLSKGIYILKLDYDGKTVSKRIVKE